MTEPKPSYFMTLANLIYLSDCRSQKADMVPELIDAFGNIGFDVLWALDEPDFRMVLVWDRTQDIFVLVICGSRVTEGTLQEHVLDLLVDVDFAPEDYGCDIKLSSGPMKGLKSRVLEAVDRLPAGRRMFVTGHSLGGNRACGCALFIPTDRIESIFVFASPKSGNQTFWNYVKSVAVTVYSFVLRADPYHAWPWGSEELLHADAEIVLHDDFWEQVPRDKIPEWNIFAQRDHDPVNYLTTLKGLGQ